MRRSRSASSQRAEDTLKTLDQEAQATRDRVLRELVEVEETEDGWVATRRRAFLDTVATTPAAERLVAAFTEARLLVQSRGEENRPVVEVAHEALLRNWPTLVQWIQHNGEALHIRRECREAAREWRQHNRDEGYLYRSARLNRAEAWAQRHGDMVGDEEQAFLQASAELRERERRQEEERRQREIKAAQNLSAARRRTIGGLVVGLVITVAIAILAIWQWNRAEEQTAVAKE